jgi:hypothetical protein
MLTRRDGDKKRTGGARDARFHDAATGGPGTDPDLDPLPTVAGAGEDHDTGERFADPSPSAA